MGIPIKVTPVSMVTLKTKQMPSGTSTLRSWDPRAPPQGIEGGVAQTGDSMESKKSIHETGNPPSLWKM